MTTRQRLSRRSTLARLGAALAAGPISRAAHGQDSAPPVALPADNGAMLETAFDQALRVTVPVYINGKGPFDFVVDTGANSSVVSTEVAAACGLPDAGAASVHGIIGIQAAPLAKVSRLRVGGVRSSDLRLPVLSAARLGASGILGLDMFRDRRIELDFRDTRFQINASGAGMTFGRGIASRIPRPFDPVTVPARFKSGQLIILDAEAMGHPITAFLDSGSQVTVANRVLRDMILGARPDYAAQAVNSQLVSATGQRAAAEFAPLPGLRLGGQLLETAFVAFADLHIFDLWDLKNRPTILIGVDILRRFDEVAFDFGRKEITFWPSRVPLIVRPVVGRGAGR
jgi:hypothetical protein